MTAKPIQGVTSPLKNLIFVAAFLIGGHLTAQSVVSPVGTNLQSGENQLSFTVGETATPTVLSGEIILTQGFHQSRLVITAINNAGNDNLEFSVGPNPTDDYLYLTFRSQISRDAKFILTDLKGNIIRQAPMGSETTRIQMFGLPPALYILKVYIDPGKPPFTYKIIKK